MTKPEPDDLLSMMQAHPKSDEELFNTGMSSSTPRSRLEPEYADAYPSCKNDPTPEQASAFTNRLKPVIDIAVRPVGDSPNVRGEAKRIVLQAAAKYDPTRSSLRNHLMQHLQGLRRYSIQQANPIRVPERVLLQHSKLKHASAELYEQLGRDPSSSELADHTGIPIDRIKYVRKYQAPLSEGMLSEPTSGDDEDSVMEHGVEHSVAPHILADLVYHDLHPRDQVIMEHSMGLHGNPVMPARQLAQKLNVTPGALSQRLAVIQHKFNELQDLNLFGT